MENQKSTTIFLIRHTEVHNPQDILYGRLGRYRISELGRKQAEVTAGVLAEAPISTIYMSPRLRARQTAKRIAEAHPDASQHVTKLLDEVLTGWQGSPHSELEAINFNFYDRPRSEDDESIEHVSLRVGRFVRNARKRYPGEMVVGVTHGDVCIIARAAALGMPLTIESLRKPNVYPGHGSITRLVFSGDHDDTYPISVEYYDPNGSDPAWSGGWVTLSRPE